MARSAYAAFATCIVAAAGTLMALLLQHRFDVSYVNAYSSRELPLHFQISTFWAGQEGSFLLWLVCGALIGLFVYRSAKEQEAPARFACSTNAASNSARASSPASRTTRALPWAIDASLGAARAALAQ